jgi:Flp pilus assembly protein TadD
LAAPAKVFGVPTPLEPPDSHRVNAALGWLDLGNPREAAAELAQLAPAVQAHPEVLEARWRLCAAERRWADALAVARAQVTVAPDDPTGWVNQSYALHELRRTAEARDLLLPKAAEFPRQSIIPYNLACYACQLGDLEEARRWLRRFLQLRSKDELRRLALNDPDLRPLWPEIRVW